jgi:DNA-binding FadR family transcriptional regulator
MNEIFQPVEPLKASQQIIEQIKRLIETGVLSEGDRLPPERTLAQTFKISRATVREALSALEIMGLIESKVGHGTFIRGVASATNYDQLIAELSKQTSPLEVMEARIALEPYLGSLAAVRATPDDLEKMRQALRNAEESKTFQEFEQWDGQFHLLIAEASKNQLLLRMTDIANNVRKEELWGTLKFRSLTQERMNAYMREHQDIYQAIEDRDAKQASKLLLKHLMHVRKNLLGE